VSSSTAEPRSRRQMLIAAGGGLAASATLLAGCHGKAPLRVKVSGQGKVDPADVPILNALLDLERHTVAAYAAGIPLLTGEAAKAAKQFLAQELAHEVALTDLITEAKQKPAKARASYDLGHPQNAEQVLALLHRLERAQLSAYTSMIPNLIPGRVRSTVAAIYANDAQHLTVLRAAIGLDPVPSAFASGAE
jgi:Ferritin-like domain